MADRNIDAFAARLSDDSLSLLQKLNAAIELRDNVELFCNGQAYPAFLKKLVPVLMRILEGPPVFVSNQEHRLRSCILEIFHKFPAGHSEVLKPYAADIVDLLLRLVKTENEDNAISSMKAILDLERHHPDATASKVQPFLDLIQEMFASMETIVQKTFDDPSSPSAMSNGTIQPLTNNFGVSPPATSGPTDLGPEVSTNRPLIQGIHSFKVFAECPIIVVTLFQTHRSCVAPNVKKFVPLIRKVLTLQAAPQRKAHADAAKRGEYQIDVSQAIKNRPAFGEMLNAQVKMMSFLAYLLRVYQHQLAEVLDAVPDMVVRLLRDCPNERSATRKELLVAIRHTLLYKCREVFLTRLDDLLDERTLLGNGLTVHETLRPLAYSLLADLIHHVRDKMTRGQICKTVAVFTKILHDTSSGTSFQTMSAKLLLNLADVVASLKDKEDARRILLDILNAIARKFADMNLRYDNAVKVSSRCTSQSLDLRAEDHLGYGKGEPDWDQVDIFNATPIRLSTPREQGNTPVDENKFLFRNLLTGLKGMFYQLRMCNPDSVVLDPANMPPNWAEASRGFSAEEVQVIRRLFREGAHVFRYYRIDLPSAETSYASPVEFLTNSYGMQSGREEKELLETFATVFHSIDPATFHELFHADIPVLYEMMFEHPALLHVPQFFLASEATSPAFAGMLLEFLMERIEDIGQPDIKRSAILLRLFKLSFMAVTLFSQPNELVLLPHITQIITKSIKLSTSAQEPMNYFYLLRSLFRSIGGGRFELLYKEILPLLEMLLEVLNNLLNSARKVQERDLYVELCLTVPARLSNLLPHLNYLMRPLVIALRAGSELVGQGLRTLELCVDNLTAEYLDPIMTPVIDELMSALWDHLKPYPYNHIHSHTTMRILGKLGGRNRKFLHKPPILTFSHYADDAPSFDLRMIGSNRDRPFPAKLGTDLAIAKLWETPKSPALKKVDPYYKRQAFHFIAAQIKLCIRAHPLPENFAACIRLQAIDLVEGNLQDSADRNLSDGPGKSIRKLADQQNDFKQLLKACMLASTLADTKELARPLLFDVCRHLTILEIGRNYAQGQLARKGFDLKSGEGSLCLEPNTLLDVIIESLASDRPDVRDVASESIRAVYDTAATLLGSKHNVEKLPFFAHLIRNCGNKCYEEEWFAKAGGTLGMKLLFFDYDFSNQFFITRQSSLLGALLYVIKDMPPDLPAATRTQSWSCLEALLRKCCSGMTKDSLQERPSPLDHLCNVMVSNLSHINVHVRKAAQDSFTIIAEVVGLETYELLMPVKDRLLQAIYMKPLRALPIPTQIGYIEAISYCLQVGHDLVALDRNAERLFTEAAALADADDALLTTKPHEYKVAQQIVDLRVACIQMLALALSTEEYNSPQQSQNRGRIIAVFFKSLYSLSPKVIEAANDGLKGVLLHTNKLPKDLLQSGLRPILMNLQDPNKLTTQGLQGLARLLALLTNYFKTEIGERLIHHIGVIASPSVLQRASFTLIEQNPQMKIVIATLNVFHLLPASATIFLKDLVEIVLRLEKSLRRTLSSPFRLPILKYLNRFLDETWTFFRDKIGDDVYGRFFAQIVSHDMSLPLRDTIRNRFDEFLPLSFEEADSTNADIAAINGVHILTSLCKDDPAWLLQQQQQQQSLRSLLVKVAQRVHRNGGGSALSPKLCLAADQASEEIMSMLIVYLEAEPFDIDFLFEIIRLITENRVHGHPSFQQYLFRNLVSSDEPQIWQILSNRILDIVARRDISHQLKTYVLRNLFNPILAMDTMRSSTDSSRQAFIDKDLIDAIQLKVWKVMSNEALDSYPQDGIDHSCLELLQMTALLLKHHKALVTDTRKEIMKFGWNFIKSEDTTNRYAAYVMIAYFLAQFDTPFKITTQIYQALLKSYQHEGRGLILQALDLIAPALPDRLKNQADGNSKYPIWARWSKRIMSEDSSNLQQSVAIFNFIARHSSLFFESRDQFLPQIIPALSKIAALPSPSLEHKKLVLNLMDMILRWERQRVAVPPKLQSLNASQTAGHDDKDRMMDSTPTSPQDRATSWAIPSSLRIMLIKYLVQFINVIPERYPTPCSSSSDTQNKASPAISPLSNKVVVKSMGLLHDFLSASMWSDLELDLLPRLLESVLCAEKADRKDEKVLTSTINILQMVRVILDVKPTSWVASQLPLLQKLLEKVIKSDNPEIQDCLNVADKTIDGRLIRPLLSRILEAVPAENQEEDDMDLDSSEPSFVAFLCTAASSALESNNLVAGISLFHTLSQMQPDKIDANIPTIMKAFQSKLIKDQLTSISGSGGQPIPFATKTPDGAQAPVDEKELELTTRLMLNAMEIISSRMGHLGEQRRPFLSGLASVLERSPNVKLCEKILDLVETWVFDSSHAFPTLKEKNAVLHKMLLFEGRSDATLLHKFLDLVVRIYEDPQISRTELTVRLEHAFLIGARASDPEMRNRFFRIFDRSLTRTANARLIYVLTSQNWDTLADTFWLSQASQLIFGAVEMSSPVRLRQEDFRLPSSTQSMSHLSDDRQKGMIIDDELEALVSKFRKFEAESCQVKAEDVLKPLCQLQHTDPKLAYNIWISLFPLCWSLLSSDDRRVLEKGIVALLTRDYHQRQLDQRPNVVQALLEGACRSKPRCKVPPQVMLYLTKTFGTWYTTIASLEDQAISPQMESSLVRESNLDALVSTYAGLQEDDFFYGTWRRRCKFVETNAALSYEQMGVWDKAQQYYEAAQIKARTGAVPFSQGEYMLWEDHWVLCAEKLQQWDILHDFAKHENFDDLHLESSWRTVEDWTSSDKMEQLGSIVKAVSDAPTPRRTFFQAFISLLQLYDSSEADKTSGTQDFNRACDESVQLSIRKWHQLPERITNAHVPVLQNFQQLVELHDAHVISLSLSQTTSQNLDQKSQELKLLLGTWRDRLPNIWDDINAWQDLVTWRQHIFGLVNRKYLALLGPQSNNASGNSYAYRGFHETAWIINRFAHVARKHHLPEVCIAQLSRIYTLPNIEIQEAFLKLREQAKCHYQNHLELTSGLDVINNTNLSYFGNQQKAEFFTLKGMFLAKLAQKEEANDAYGTALYYDIRLPKAWAEWGFYNDMKFKADPTNINPASEAVSCYLEAAGLQKNSKSRKLLSRVLWLLSVDTAEGKIAQAFEDFKGETPVWYWITFIPQLLTSLSHREARVARTVLLKIAVIYPQSLFFLLRTVREDLLIIKKNEDQRRGRLEKEKSQSKDVPDPEAKTPASAAAAPSSPNKTQDEKPRPSTANGSVGSNDDKMTKEEPKPAEMSRASTDNIPDESLKKPWEYADEIYAKLKTMFPLLAYSMESLVDQILKHFKCPPDEDAYRLIVALLNDGFNYVARSPSTYAGDSKLPQGTEANIHKFADTILPVHIRSSFEEDFVAKKPTMYEYIHKLRKWRDKFEEKLDRREPCQPLVSYSHTLSEFRFAKFEDVEVPGQYLQHLDKNNDFVKIERILPSIDLVRSSGFSHRRIKFRGHDGSVHPFAIQHPTARHSRREERILQLFRIFNGILGRGKESRRRNLGFTLPLMQPLAPSVRLVQDDPSYISLQLVYEDYCRRAGVNRDEPLLFTLDKLRSGIMLGQNQTQESVTALRMEIFTAICKKWVPQTIALDYFQAIYPNFADFFLFRKRFSYQFAALTFMTYVMHISQRSPSKLNISRATGNIWGSELIPALTSNRPVLAATEFVPFRLTPNLMTLMGPLACEGLFAPALMAIASCLAGIHEPGSELEQQLAIFVRDEIVFWHTQQRQPIPTEERLRTFVQDNVDLVVKKAVSLAKPPDGTLPANQTVIDLIAKAVDPRALSATDALWMGYL